VPIGRRGNLALGQQQPRPLRPAPG